MSAQIRSMLDKCMTLLQQSDIETVSDMLLHELNDVRRSMPASEWRDDCLPAARRHPAMELLLQCPFSRHSFTRPRGYAGDALLIDYLYQEETVEPYIRAAGTLGRTLCDMWVDTPAPAAVRERRDILADLIDELTAAKGPLDILSVACGHGREFELSKAVAGGAVARIVALDQDSQTTEFLASLGIPALNILTHSIRPILLGNVKQYGRFDLIYAAGLYDYLNETVARRLSMRMFSMLKPGGSLLIPNFLPDTANRGSMELIQDWHLIYRSKDEILGLQSAFDVEEVSAVHYFEDSTGSIGFMRVDRT